MRRPSEAFVFVRRQGEYLILHRSPAQGDYWHGVAGALEDGESYAEAAARELREETGLHGVALVDLGRAYTYPVDEEPERRPLYGPGVTEITVACFAADAPAGWEPTLDWEHDGYRWCTVEEAAQLLFWPEPRDVLRAIA
jgi:8-oxo-dGTP pyrophosphatase MutT (NUDIX family)